MIIFNMETRRKFNVGALSLGWPRERSTKKTYDCTFRLKVFQFAKANSNGPACMKWTKNVCLIGERVKSNFYY